jgi:hypothetical protein
MSALSPSTLTLVRRVLAACRRIRSTSGIDPLRSVVNGSFKEAKHSCTPAQFGRSTEFMDLATEMHVFRKRVAQAH